MGPISSSCLSKDVFAYKQTVVLKQLYEIGPWTSLKQCQTLGGQRRNPQIFRLCVMCGSTIDSYGQTFKRGTKFDHWAILPGTQDVLHALVTMELTSC